MEFEERFLVLNTLGEKFCIAIFFFSFSVLGNELKALHVLGEHSPTGWYHHPCTVILSSPRYIWLNGLSIITSSVDVCNVYSGCVIWLSFSQLNLCQICKEKMSLFFLGLGQNQLPKKIFLYHIMAYSHKVGVHPVFNLILSCGSLNKIPTDLISEWFCCKDSGHHLYFPLFKVITCCT